MACADGPLGITWAGKYAASTLQGLPEVRVIYKGLKCSGFIQGSRQSPSPRELASEAQTQGAGWVVPASEP